MARATLRHSGMCFAAFAEEGLPDVGDDDVTYVEYHRVLPVELQSRLHERCAELLFARGVMWWLACGGQRIISAMGITITNNNHAGTQARQRARAPSWSSCGGTTAGS